MYVLPTILYGTAANKFYKQNAQPTEVLRNRFGDIPNPARQAKRERYEANKRRRDGNQQARDAEAREREGKRFRLGFSQKM